MHIEPQAGKDYDAQAFQRLGKSSSAPGCLQKKAMADKGGRAERSEVIYK